MKNERGYDGLRLIDADSFIIIRTIIIGLILLVACLYWFFFESDLEKFQEEDTDEGYEYSNGFQWK